MPALHPDCAEALSRMRAGAFERVLEEDLSTGDVDDAEYDDDAALAPRRIVEVEVD